MADDFYGLRKLKECNMVVLRAESTCCNLFYTVSSEGGTLLTSKGRPRYRMIDRDERMVMGLYYKNPCFVTPYMLVQVVNAPDVKVVVEGGFSKFNMMIVDERDQTRLRVKTPMVNNTLKDMAVNAAAT